MHPATLRNRAPPPPPPSCSLRQGLSGFLETGSILIESSTSVLRADEALSTLLPLVPGCRYFR